MKVCPKCQSQLNDNPDFCTSCGSLVEKNVNQQQDVINEQTQQVYTYYDRFDHSNEFDESDISNNKVFAMLVYLTGWIGIIVALLASDKSSYVGFHVRQALKFTVIEILVGIITALFFWTVIIPVVCGILFIVLFVIKIICFFQICNGKAKEPYIIRNFSFLK